MKIKLSAEFSDKQDRLQELNKKNRENFFELKKQAEQEAEGGGPLSWFNYPLNSGLELVEQLETLRSETSFYYNLVVVVGIGGSFSGTKAVNDLFGVVREGPSKSHRKPILFLGNNLSERDAIEKLELIENYEPVICVVSKSGTTLETSIAHCILEESLASRYSKRDIEKRTFYATHETGSPLLNHLETPGDKLSPIPSDIVGRYSLFTSASLLPLALAGHNIRDLMKGACDFFQKAKEEDQSTLESLSYACYRYLAWEEGKRIEVMAYHEPHLEGLSIWWQQLFAESEGKNSKGLFPIPSLFSRDLHSIGQYLQEGFPSVFETFLIVENGGLSSESSLQKRIRIPTNDKARKLLGQASGHYLTNLNEQIMTASYKAHTSRGVPCCKIVLNQLTELSFGSLLAFFQTSCVLSAKLLEVNPYNQPGVESYKKEFSNLFN